MATVKQSADPKKSAKNLKTAVESGVAEAVHDAKTGDVETVSQASGGPMKDLPTGSRRSHPAE